MKLKHIKYDYKEDHSKHVIPDISFLYQIKKGLLTRDKMTFTSFSSFNYCFELLNHYIQLDFVRNAQTEFNA